jgi:hypothetical protein
LNNAQRACDDLVVDQQKGNAWDRDVDQTSHGARPVVRVDVAVDDAGKHARQTRREQQHVGLAMLA